MPGQRGQTSYRDKNMEAKKRGWLQMMTTMLSRVELMMTWPSLCPSVIKLFGNITITRTLLSPTLA